MGYTAICADCLEAFASSSAVLAAFDNARSSPGASASYTGGLLAGNTVRSEVPSSSSEANKQATTVRCSAGWWRTNWERQTPALCGDTNLDVASKQAAERA